MIRTNAREILLYGGASGAAFAVDAGTLWFLVQQYGLHYLLAASVSFIAGAVVAYLLCITMVFRFRRLHSGPMEELSIFVGVGVIGLGVNTMAMAFGVSLLQLHLLVAKLASAALTFGLNFTLRKLYLFNPASASNPSLRSGDHRE